MSDARRPSLERWAERALGDREPQHLGTGWWSGVASVFLGVLACGGVLVLHFPGWLSMAELRGRYPLPWMRGLIEVVVLAGFLAGSISLVLRERKVLGAVGVALASLAVVAGGGSVPIDDAGGGRLYLGLDWFLLSVFVLALVFVPLERIRPRDRDQRTFRVGWTTDVQHFFLSHVFVQVLTLLTLLPGNLIGAFVVGPRWIAEQPLALQVVELVVLGDLLQYAAHRLFHTVPLLWRFHAVHHSSRAIDWLAGSRLHLVDATLTRAIVVAPILVLGFAQSAFYVWLVVLTAQAIFVHANLGTRFGFLERLLVTPRYHHWHHAADPAAANANFAVQLPWIDRLFGTQHLPDGAWPARYGLDGDPVPEGFAAQLAWPFGRGAREAARE